MKFPSEVLKESVLQGESDEEYGLQLIEESEWIDDGRHQNRHVVFKFQDKYYIVYESRTGSYFDEYYYDSEDWKSEVECPEVTQKQITKTIWVKVQNTVNAQSAIKG